MTNPLRCLLLIVLLTSCAETPGAKPGSVAPLPASAQPKINIIVLGCDTGLDVSHGMGEVTNAYITVRNVDGEATSVCATLTASDEGRAHPDKTKCVQHLPINNEVTHKLTIDTAQGQASSIEVTVTTAEGVRETSSRSSCQEIDPDTVKSILGIVKPF